MAMETDTNQISSPANVEVDRYFDNLPPGYRFFPTDEELVIFYLKNKISNQPLPPNMIRELYIYDYSPRQLTENYRPFGLQEWYYFTPRVNKYPKGTRPNRVARNGYWKASGVDKIIEVDGVVVARRKTLVFYEGKAPNDVKTGWIMHEYYLKGEQRKTGGKLGYALCKIFEKEVKKGYKKKRNGKDMNVGLDSLAVNEDQTNVLKPSSSASNDDIQNQFQSFQYQRQQIQDLFQHEQLNLYNLFQEQQLHDQLHDHFQEQQLHHPQHQQLYQPRDQFQEQRQLHQPHDHQVQEQQLHQPRPHDHQFQEQQLQPHDQFQEQQLHQPQPHDHHQFQEKQLHQSQLHDHQFQEQQLQPHDQFQEQQLHQPQPHDHHQFQEQQLHQPNDHQFQQLQSHDIFFQDQHHLQSHDQFQYQQQLQSYDQFQLQNPLQSQQPQIGIHFQNQPYNDTQFQAADSLQGASNLDASHTKSFDYEHFLSNIDNITYDDDFTFRCLI